MRLSVIFRLVFVVVAGLPGTSVSGLGENRSQEVTSRREDKPRQVRDILWVWGNPEMETPGTHTIATFAQASPAERARLLGVPNIILAGNGLPDDDRKAQALMRGVARAPRHVWEISPDGETAGPPFVYKETVDRIARLAERYPSIEGVLLDDMTSQMIKRGFKPAHIRRIRERLSVQAPNVKVWGVVYTMNLDIPRLDTYIRQLDVINLWVWHAKNIVDLEKNVARCEREYPGKPIVLGLYLYDYGQGRRMPQDLLEKQCETALALVRTGRIRGIVFLTIKNDERAVQWTSNWIRRVGKQPLGRDTGPARDRP